MRSEKRFIMYIYNKAEIDSKVFRFIYGCALNDAILQKSFQGKRIWIYGVQGAEDEVRKYINRVLKGDFKENTTQAKDAHDKAFLDTAQNVCKAINEYSSKPAGAGLFHFGNAQKLINMTVKHVYAHVYTIHTVEYPSIREHFRWCNSPMDQDMLNTVWKHYNGSEYKYKKDFCAPWGCEDFDEDTNNNPCLPKRYVAFQSTINEIIKNGNDGVFPIEYDYIDWKNQK